MEHRQKLETMMMANIHKRFADDETVAQRAASAAFNILWPEIEKLTAFQSDATMQIIELQDKVNGLIQQIPVTKYIPQTTDEETQVGALSNKRSNLSLVEPSQENEETTRRNRPIVGRAIWSNLPPQVKKEIREMNQSGYSTPEELMAAKKYFFRLFAGFEKKQGKSFHRISASAIWLFPHLNFLLHSTSTDVKQLWRGFQQFRDEYEFWLRTTKVYADNMSLPPVEWDNSIGAPKAGELITVTNAAGTASRTIPVNPDTTYKEGPTPKKRGRKPGTKNKPKVLVATTLTEPPANDPLENTPSAEATEEKKELAGVGV